MTRYSQTHIATILGLATLPLLAAPGCSASVDDGDTATRAEQVGAVEHAINSAASCVHIVRGSAGDVADATIANKNPPTNYGSTPQTFAGTLPGPTTVHALLKVDLAPITAVATLPGYGGSTTVTSATLTLRGPAGQAAATVDLHTVTAPWVENAVTWQSFGAAFNPVPSQSFTNFSGGLPPSTQIGIQSLVQQWLDGTLPNDGILLKQATGSTKWLASESSTAAARPSADVCFTVSCAAGFDDCNASALDACETALGTISDCSACGDACDDGDACTTDACDPVVGCSHTAITCDDGDACTTDTCNPATGCGTTPVSCDDGDACTLDACNPATGCGYTNLCVPIASGQNFPLAIAVDATNVYWGNLGDHTIHSMPIGGGANTVLSTTSAGPYAIALNATDAFWSEDGLVQTVPKAGGATTAFGVGQPAPRGIAADASDVYWANYFGNSIVKCPAGGCGGTPALFGTGQNTGDVAVDATNVYWLNGGDGQVLMCPKTGCNGFVGTLLGTGGTAHLATDGVNVYWTQATAIAAVPVGGGATTLLATGLAAPSGIATDGASVYWTELGSGTVKKCAVGGCSNAPTILAIGLVNPNVLTVDGTNVYFTDTNAGNVWQLPK